MADNLIGPADMGAIELSERVEALSLALRRIASTETFTSALDLTHPTRVRTEAVIDELQARMRYAAEAVGA